MTPVPLDLPLRPSEAAELAGLIFETAEQKPLADDLRNRIAARAAALRLETIVPYFGSLVRDPVHHSTYYLAVDVHGGQPQLLHIALATAPTSSVFPKPLLVGRMRRAGGPEIVINAIPFGSGDGAALEGFANRIDKAFLPRPQGARTTIVAPPGEAAFDAFSAIWKRTGRNVAAIGADLADPAGAAYSAGLWAAIRKGWRDGYSAVVRVSAPEAVADAAAFSTYVFDAAPYLGGTGLPAVEHDWILQQFSQDFTSDTALQLAGRFGEALLAAERVLGQIRQARSARKINRPFDFEFALDRATQPTTPRDMVFCLQWLKARGHAAQLAAPNLQGAGEDEVRALVDVCRRFQCAIDIAGEFASQWDMAARASAGRLTCSLWNSRTGAGEIERAAESLLG